MSFLLPLSVTINLVLFFVFLWQFNKHRQAHRERKRIILATRSIFQIILEDLDFKTVVQKVADIIPKELQYETGVLAIYDEQKGVIKRVAFSQTTEAKEAIYALKAFNKPFQQIDIPITDSFNLMAKALRENKPYITNSTYDVMRPTIDLASAEKIQKIMGIKTTLVYPIYMKNKPFGVFIASTGKAQDKISEYEKEIIEDFVSLVGLVLQNSLLFTSLKETKDSLTNMTKEVYKSNAELHQLDKLKDDFVSMASHELRTPLTAIRSYVWLALNKPDIILSEKMKKYLSRSLISTERLITLINEMLNISRIESGRIEITPHAVNMVELVKQMLPEIEPKAQEKQIHIVLQETPLPKVFADGEKVQQVLMNLVGNALKFTPADGMITISFFSDGKTVETIVKDSGVGISREDISKLFKKFGRLDSSYVAAATTGGTGLGLFICKSIIELMKGKIWAQSEGLGKGTSFIFSLPIATADLIAEAERYGPKSIGEAKGLEPVSL